MSDRRWGRVTVEGWIQEAPGEWRVVTAKTGSAGIVAVAYKIPVGASVEFLPEPVQFKDGDAATTPTRSVSYLRVNGCWVHSGGGPNTYTDSTIKVWLDQGKVVRLVPEANDG